MATNKPTLLRSISVSQLPPINKQAVLYMALLALQFGMQPGLTRAYTPPTVPKSTVVLAQEIVKFLLAGTMLYLSGGTRQALDGWTVHAWVSIALLPAALYAVQNLCSLMAYQNLDPLTYNVLNQTKILSAALCVYLILGRKQSRMQILALMLLLSSALIMEHIITLDWIMLGGGEVAMEEDEKNNEWETRHLTHGVGPILIASFISGLAGALSQKNLQAAGGAGRNAYFFSMELCVGSVLLLGITLLVSPDGQHIRQDGFFDGWTLQMMIPILTNAIGGILVGLVTKHAGSVRKGFALIFGILISGLIQEFFHGTGSAAGVTNEQILGGILAATSLWMHATHPPVKEVKKKKE